MEAPHTHYSDTDDSPSSDTPLPSRSFIPPGSLETLSDTYFTVLRHSHFPGHSVRIKKSYFCDGKVQAFTGYIDVEARHLFFYFFESRRDPAKDDVVLWAYGGLGCSSSFGVFMELGPCVVISPNSTMYNPYGWNEYANMIFIDQPIGVGFSYAELNEFVSKPEEAAKDVTAFVTIFFEHFTQFRGRPFHMAGESYGGRYIPVFASEVYDRNAELQQAGLLPINLTSIVIGNGCTDNLKMVSSYYDMACLPRPVDPVLDINTCITMKRGLSRCEQWSKDKCGDRFDPIDCLAAASFCAQLLMKPMYMSGYNHYDLSKKYDSALQDMCYPVIQDISAYLDRLDVRRAIGVDASIVSNFTACSADINSAFREAMDWAAPTQYYIEALLERGIRVLLYVGERDWGCNWVSNERMTLDLQWSGQAAYLKEPVTEWHVDGVVAGRRRSVGPLTFTIVLEAGHMAPYDQPKVALEMFRRWLSNESL